MDLIDRQDAIDALDKDPMGGLNYNRILNGLPSAQQWVPCRMINQCFIPELENDGYLQILITYFTGKKKKPQVTTAWIENGRILNKKYSDIRAWMPMPEPWKGEQDG